MGRHLGYISVTGELLQSMFFTAGPSDHWFQVEQGIPPDAHFLRWFFDDYTNRLNLVYEHPSFPLTHDGSQMTRLDLPTLRTCYVTMDEVEEAHRRRAAKLFIFHPSEDTIRRSVDAIGKEDACHVVTYQGSR